MRFTAHQIAFKARAGLLQAPKEATAGSCLEVFSASTQCNAQQQNRDVVSPYAPGDEVWMS
jgi:hypothetical protein